MQNVCEMFENPENIVERVGWRRGFSWLYGEMCVMLLNEFPLSLLSIMHHLWYGGWRGGGGALSPPP